MDNVFSKSEAATLLGKVVDDATDSGDVETLKKAIKRAADLFKEAQSEQEKASIAYCRANAHSALRHIGMERDPKRGWGWDEDELKHEIYWLRVALTALTASSGSIKDDLILRVLTNLANALNHMGRFCEAIEYWDKALAIDANFGMALVNKGQGLFWYARAVYDGGHQTLFLWQARKALIEGIKAGVEDYALEAIQKTVEHIDSHPELDFENFEFELNGDSIGEDEREEHYRRWCLSNRLFMNPLNDLGENTIAARDILSFPSTRQPITDNAPTVPIVYGVYNQLVQEFVSARYMVYEALSERDANDLHFSDRDVLLYDTLDYRVLRLWTEKLKMGYLSAYAIFDKMAYLLNHYLKLNIAPNRVQFGSLWFNKCRPEKGIRSRLESSENWPLRGLFSVSRDLYWSKDETFTMEPEARTLYNIRNHIAHKYLTIHDSFCSEVSVLGMASPESELSYSIGDDELELATIKLLKLVRSALIYLSLGANWHEQTQHRDDGSLYLPVPLHPLSEKR